jgi:hypothetical protein
MSPTAFPAAFRHRRDARPCLYLGGVLIALVPGTKGRQPRRHHRSRPGQRIKYKEIGMRFGRLLNLLI